MTPCQSPSVRWNVALSRNNRLDVSGSENSARHQETAGFQLVTVLKIEWRERSGRDDPFGDLFQVFIIF